ncbi:MAG TPA: hypothetical protein VLB03_10270 [Nocardioidaceae bacterium]|nr:hypothetical protein [Nocardioidaceae bacterium]
MLKECSRALSEEYDLALLDLDGVVYIGPDAVDGAAERLAAASAAGMALAYVTNNASRPPAKVAGHLTALGIPAEEDDVVTSAQAAARLLRETLEPGSPVFVIGGQGLFEALDELGLRGVQSLEDAPVAVVSGYNPDLRWRTLTDGAILVRRGSRGWRRTPTSRCPLPPAPASGTASSSTSSLGSPDGNLWWPASPVHHCSRRPGDASGARAHWSWATGWTPISKAPTTRVLTAFWC